MIYLRSKIQQDAQFYSQFISKFNLYIYRADLLLIIRRYYSVHAAVGICHAHTSCSVYRKVPPDDEQ